ncbi:MAG: hypothetical protein D6743_09980, partial [Calditrichaeota bacterium]
AWPQEKEGEKKKGKLGKFGDSITKDEDEDSNDGGGFSVFSIVDPLDVVEMLSHMKPGPYPYNPVTHTLRPDSALPGGTVRIHGAFFQHEPGLYGLEWRYDYQKRWFYFTFELVNLLEDLGDRTDRLDFTSARAGYTFLQRDQYSFTGELGFRSMLTDRSVSGPEVGLKFTAFPGAPLVLEAAGTLALLNERAVSTFRADLGVMIWRVEVLVGGQLFRSPSITIDGWKAGLRFWL